MRAGPASRPQDFKAHLAKNKNIEGGERFYATPTLSPGPGRGVGAPCPSLPPSPLHAGGAEGLWRVASGRLLVLLLLLPPPLPAPTEAPRAAAEAELRRPANLPAAMRRAEGAGEGAGCAVTPGWCVLRLSAPQRGNAIIGLSGLEPKPAAELSFPLGGPTRCAAWRRGARPRGPPLGAPERQLLPGERAVFRGHKSILCPCVPCCNPLGFSCRIPYIMYY